MPLVNFEEFSAKIVHLFFLWSFVKYRAYANKPVAIPELKSNIKRIIGEIQPHPEKSFKIE